MITAEEFIKNKIRQNYQVPKDFSLHLVDFLNAEKAMVWIKEYADLAYQNGYTQFTADNAKKDAAYTELKQLADEMAKDIDLAIDLELIGTEGFESLTNYQNHTK